MTAFSMSPGRTPSVAAFVPEKNGVPASIRIFSLGNFEVPILIKTFFKADSVEMLWNKLGVSLLVWTHTEVDASGLSYYGEASLYYFSIAGKFECRVPIAGFGNLAGEMDFFDRLTCQKVGHAQASNSSFCDWCPDGRHVITATLTPRLRVDNGFKIWHYTGVKLFECDIKELYQISWRPIQPDVFPPHNSLSPPPKGLIEDTSKSSEKKPVGVYRPPGARASASNLSLRDNSMSSLSMTSTENITSKEDRSSEGLSTALGPPVNQLYNLFKTVPNVKLYQYTSDGRFLGYVNQEGVIILDAVSYEPIREFKKTNVIDINFSPKGKFLALYTKFVKSQDPDIQPHNMFIYEVSTGELKITFVQKSQNNWKVQWTDDESVCARLVTGEVHFYDTRKFDLDNLLHPPSGLNNNINSNANNPKRANIKKQLSKRQMNQGNISSMTQVNNVNANAGNNNNNNNTKNQNKGQNKNQNQKQAQNQQNQKQAQNNQPNNQGQQKNQNQSSSGSSSPQQTPNNANKKNRNKNKNKGQQNQQNGQAQTSSLNQNQGQQQRKQKKSKSSIDLQNKNGSKPSSPTGSPNQPNSPNVSNKNPNHENQKKIKTLQRKLREIGEIKAKHAAGQKLEHTQIIKMEKESELAKELEACLAKQNQNNNQNQN
ncbi:hypothetical protein PIROE2DRAFT_69538 [Piromyces sp. E2]|nr:hypothetical protein PIROE2DRAFT_69538 [Piromyces sp. E2]|eukprot:OUM62102.1 hypothetical protein PIROE2DRAFT_69538 [Piromyces sp. E2]